MTPRRKLTEGFKQQVQKRPASKKIIKNQKSNRCKRRWSILRFGDHAYGERLTVYVSSHGKWWGDEYRGFLVFIANCTMIK
jgi:hypothetical protein